MQECYEFLSSLSEYGTQALSWHLGFLVVRMKVIVISNNHRQDSLLSLSLTLGGGRCFRFTDFPESLVVERLRGPREETLVISTHALFFPPVTWADINSSKCSQNNHLCCPSPFQGMIMNSAIYGNDAV